ncbi:MAG: proline--tRNA ligase [Candidatus Marinimicrobia bacterium]|nr:proline--tRNA ligase [Candidatus Neomarinimicrobiota bacterium]|tara:strand:- start:14389 stop:15861 length:1473 start_codon:yes stop_codon:yes gene_type:complete
MSKGVTPKTENYSKWYTDVITKAKLADYGPVKGTMVIRPYGYQLWENLKDSLDYEFKQTGHTNAYFPLFIPKSFLAKEAEHVEGFAKECAIVTHSRLKNNKDKTGLIPDPDSKLEEEIIVRPTSETVIWSMYKKWINSYRDLPILINQWANVVRWEMRTRLFLRTSEFLWQEGHTAHSNAEEAEEETLKILDIYRDVVENVLAIPVLYGKKTEAEKFAGAETTYCIEAMMGDKRALQAGTSHNLGQNFAKAFDVKFQDVDNTEKFVYATSWGVSTRLIGALIMVHGDDKGLRLPPNIAPIQIIIVPIYKTEDELEKIKEFLTPTFNFCNDNQIRYQVDERSKISPGYKFNEWEMKGVPIRVEVGIRDLENGNLTIVRRDSSEKIIDKVEKLTEKLDEILQSIQDSLFNQALEFQQQNTKKVSSYSEFKSQITSGAFIDCGWDGSSETESKIKSDTNATIRCIPMDQNINNLKCIYTEKPAKYQVIFAKAY